jgi:type I restriction enzyme, R subunit
VSGLALQCIEADDRVLFKRKCDNVFDLVVDLAARGRRWAA